MIVKIIFKDYYFIHSSSVHNLINHLSLLPSEYRLVFHKNYIIHISTLHLISCLHASNSCLYIKPKFSVIHHTLKK